MAVDSSQQLSQDVEVLRQKVAGQLVRLREIRAEYESIRKALRERGIAIEVPFVLRPPFTGRGTLSAIDSGKS